MQGALFKIPPICVVSRLSLFGKMPPERKKPAESSSSSSSFSSIPLTITPPFPEKKIRFNTPGVISGSVSPLAGFSPMLRDEKKIENSTFSKKYSPFFGKMLLVAAEFSLLLTFDVSSFSFYVWEGPRGPLLFLLPLLLFPPSLSFWGKSKFGKKTAEEGAA